MLRFLCIVFSILQFTIFANANGIYSIVCPGAIRSDFNYNVAISLHKADGPCQIKVGISGPSYTETKTVDVQPLSTVNVDFNVPQLKSGEYKLTAVGLSGLTFENSTALNFGDYEASTFIQTDKATYKAGDLVQFRVLFLDENTRPARIHKPIKILIKDGAQNLITQLKDVKPEKGVYTGKFQLSEQPVLGNWIIDVIVGEVSSETKYFGVAKYVLPKYTIAIETAKDVAIPNKFIKVTVLAKYTYGKAVKGKATVSLTTTEQQYGTPNLISVKTINIDGKGFVEFDLSKDSSYRNWEKLVTPRLKIIAVMEEELTGIKLNTSAIINLHKNLYTIIGIDTPRTYQKGVPLKFKIAVNNFDGSPVLDTTKLVTLKLQENRYLYDNLKPTEYKSKLDGNGMAIFELMIPEENDHYYAVQCTYQNITAYFPPLTKFKPNDKTEELKIIVKTEKPMLTNDVFIEITSSEPLPYFVYTIVARGNILKSEHVDVPEGRKSHTIKFTPSFEMIPHTKIYVHYVSDNNLRFQETNITFVKKFENSLYINATSESRPGEDVEIEISSDPDSFVGLIGVDQSVLTLKPDNDLKTDGIFNSLNKFETKTPAIDGIGRYPGQMSGLVTLTNANYPWEHPVKYEYVWRPNNRGGLPYDRRGGGAAGGAGAGGAGAGGGIDVGIEGNYVRVRVPPKPQQQLHSQPNTPKMLPKMPPKIRMEFPETWFFQNIENIGTGHYTMVKKIPDTITSWVITGFSLSAKTGFTLTESSTNIQVFQPFFISTNLPYSVKRGEVIAIPVIIFNYMDKALDAEVTMDNSDKEYEFTEATNEVDENPSDEVKRVKRVTIPSNTGKSVSFMIRPKKVGETTLKITAATPLAGDAIHQKLKVAPEGVTQYENRAIFVNLKDKPEYSENINVDIPAEAVPESEYIEFSVVGDLLGPTIKNLDKLVRMPYGCGEQNMVNFVPNILVLKYLEAINQNMPSIVEKAKKFLEIGYQRELTYKHDDGSYSAFGKSDKAGSTWLTAYVVRSFHQAAKYTFIDVEILKDGLDFLVSRQLDSGKFVEHGKLIDIEHQNELGLNAFVLLAFFENVVQFPKYQVNIDKGLRFLSENVNESDDLYSLAIADLVFRLAKNPLADKVLAKLQSAAKVEDDRRWWSKEPNTKTVEPESQFRPRSSDVEITSYVLLALLEEQPAESTLPIIKWLISQRNSNGGFASTQDTVVGLQALIKFAEKTGFGSENMNIDFVSTGDTENKGSITVNTENTLVLQTHLLPKTTRQVNFTAKGKGSAIMQLSYRYNLAEKDKKPNFQLTSTVKGNTPQQLIVEVCVEYVPLEKDNAKKESNMAVLEVALPSGYTAEAEGFENIKSVEHVKRVETKNSDSEVIVYFDSLDVGKITCVPIEASKTHAVAKQKPAAVQIYDYYDTKRRATEYYEVVSSLCDICEGDDCGTACKNTKNV